MLATRALSSGVSLTTLQMPELLENSLDSMMDKDISFLIPQMSLLIAMELLLSSNSTDTWRTRSERWFIICY